ncbi:MAG: hypothetical protein RLO52_20875 [Sandaracinaceae bacterium]
MRPWLALALTVGCASTPSAPPRVGVSDALVRWESEGAGGRAESRALARTPRRTTRIASSAPVRWVGGPRIDLELHRAPLGEALRFVAEAAGYGVVLGEGLERTVTVSLRRVPALEALAAIAEAHRVSLERVGRNVLVRSL